MLSFEVNSFSQKATVFTTTTLGKLETSSGYCAEIVKILQQKLGFIAELSKTSGFGNYKGNGVGTGMFGTLLRQASTIRHMFLLILDYACYCKIA